MEQDRAGLDKLGFWLDQVLGTDSMVWAVETGRQT